jgi:hypothetical protein
VETIVLGAAKPTAQKTEIAMAWLLEGIEHMVAGLVEVESISLFMSQ